MDPTPDAADPALLETLVARCIEAMDRGETNAIAQVCAAHPSLQTRVEEHLGRLRARGILADTEPHALPAAIGPYRVLAEVGEGGMGSVYLAEQQEPIRRQVALKVIKPGMDTREVLARFQAERQTLALMSHPNIAQVYDAGSTPDGRPYFVMEFVAGEAITSWCERMATDIAGRLRLFATVCRGVQHAHERGVIHRDLKPSNVLVAEHGGEAVPKIIDFGIAKAMSPEVGATRHTRIDQLLGTPEYMSPEQATSGGVDVDVRSDVYSLGVMLYELLTGALPFASARLRASGLRDLERILVEEVPPAPSTQVNARIAAACRSSMSELRRRLRGELDWVVSKAIAKESARRYASPLALAEDLERHLRHEPVLAGPPSTWYRVRKLMRRHRVEATAAALITGSLVAGLAVSVRFWLQARDRAVEAEAARVSTRDFYGLAREAVDTMLVRVADDRLEHVPQAEAVRRELLADALAFYQELEAREPADASLRREVAHARSATASILRDLGRVPEALQASQRALAQIDTMLAAEPENARLLRLRASARSTQALVRLNLGEVQQACDLHRDVVADLERADALDPSGADRKRMSAALSNLGMSLVQVRPDAACEALAKSLALVEASLAPGDDGLELAKLRANFGAVLADSGNFDGAVRELRQAVAVLTAAADPGPQRSSLARAHLTLGDALRAGGDAAAAVPEYNAAERIQRALVRDFPATPGAREVLAGILANTAIALDAAGDGDAALRANQESLDLRRSLVADHAAHVGYRTTLVRTLANRVSTLLGRAGDHPNPLAAAEALAAEAATAVQPLATLAPEDPDSEFLAAAVASMGATIALRQGDSASAAQGFARARETMERLLPRAAGWLELYRHLASASENEAIAMLVNDDAAARDALARARRHIDGGLAVRADDAHLRGLLRSVLVRSAKVALEAGDVTAAATLADDLGAAFPDVIIARVVAGEIHARCGERLGDGPEREACVARALSHLAAARRAGFEPPTGWPEDSSFGWLRGRDAFAAAMRAR